MGGAEFRPRPVEDQFGRSGGSGGGQTFENVSQVFSAKRVNTTPAPSFVDVKSVFEEEAPSIAQRRLAFDFYNGIASLVGRPGQLYYPSPLDMVELHQVHLDAIRKSVGQDEIVPEYSLTHVIGAGKRLFAHAQIADPNQREGQHDTRTHANLEILLMRAAKLEAIQYPLILQRDAVSIQQNLREEASAFLTITNPEYTFPFSPLDIHVAYLQLFPEEHPNEAVRQRTTGAVLIVEMELSEVRETGSNGRFNQFGIREALARATEFGRDDIQKYSLIHVYGASKREVLKVDVHTRWNDTSRDTFAVHSLLKQAVGAGQS